MLRTTLKPVNVAPLAQLHERVKNDWIRLVWNQSRYLHLEVLQHTRTEEKNQWSTHSILCTRVKKWLKKLGG